MGTNVQFDNYYTMRDLNHDSNGSSWPLHHGENNLPAGQYNYNLLPRPTPDVNGAIDKELLKQKMLEHEAIFRSQVFELHRLYRVQKDLMDAMRRQEQCSHRTNFETSSSSSPFPSQRRNSASFLFKNGVCGTPQVIDVENVKGKNCASPRNSEASECRPSKVRKMIDLQLPADEYMDTDEVEQCENTKSVLADLNEPLEPEETNRFQNGDLVTTAPGLPESGSRKQEHGFIAGTRKNLHYNDRGNGHNWFLSVPQTEGSKDNRKSYHHINLSRPEQVVFENRHQPPGLFPPHHGNSRFEGIMASHLPSNVPYSNLVNSWENCWRRPSSYPSHTSTSVQMTSFRDKSCQSTVQGNGFLDTWWSRNDKSRSEAPVKNGGSSSGVYKDLHASLNGSYNDRAASGTTSFMKGIDLNSTVLAKGEDSVPVLPWLRVLDHQNSVTSTSCNVDATREEQISNKTILGVPIFKAEERAKESEKEKKRVLFDINVACDDPEESPRRNMIDLNTCVMEEEILSVASHTNSNSSSSANTIKKPKRRVMIDLEAPVNMDDEDEEDDVICPAGEQLDDTLLARVAAEAIVDISTLATTTTSAPENALHWFADIACISPRESDYLEEMTLKLTECTVEEYFPNPPNFETLTVDETGPTNVTGRARRGPARRGRQRRDFQRDILPGLASLARNEVTEDLQTFGGLMRATGHTWQSGTRRNSSGRGRKKAVVAVTPPPPPVASSSTATVFSPHSNNKNGEIMLEDRSLTSWGKTTRRPRRQRCPPATTAAANPTPIPLT